VRFKLGMNASRYDLKSLCGVLDRLDHPIA
jgi:hypothetical protein